MKQFLVTVGGVFVGLLLFFVGLPIILIASLSGKSDKSAGMPSEIVLSLDLRGNIPDQPPTNPFAIGSAPSVVGIVETLQAAEKDKRVKGVYVRGNDEGVSPAAAQEIRDALNNFRKSGKFVIAHMQTEINGAVSSYAMISDADEIWMQSASDFQATGVGTETMFLGGAFEKFSMQPQFEQFYEYKNAANVYTQKTFTAAHREATTSLLQGLYTDLTADIAQGRKMTPAAVKAVMEAGPYTGEEALAKKLVDKLGRPADAEKAALDRAGKDSDLVEFAEYAESKHDARGSGDAVALVMGEGGIVTGDDDSQPLSSEAVFASDTISKALLDAAKDDDVKAVVFRVSSPGGSAIASDQIWDAVEKVKAAGKPVVVSMGSYAASGGYYVSTGADKIVAWPSTITGSIGVLGGKVVIGGAVKKYIGANSESILVGGPNTGALSANEPFTNYQREQFHRLMANIYEDFTGKVATGRKIPIARVKEIAKGRVWTGTQAKGIGLVDQYGGLRASLALARSMAKLKDDSRVIHYPTQKSPIEFIQEFFGASSEAARAAASLSVLLGDEHVAQAVKAIRDEQRAGIRTEMTPIEVR